MRTVSSFQIRSKAWIASTGHIFKLWKKRGITNDGITAFVLQWFNDITRKEESAFPQEGNETGYSYLAINGNPFVRR